MGEQKITVKDLKALRSRTIALERECIRLGKFEKEDGKAEFVDALKEQIERESQIICKTLEFIANIKDDRIRSAVAMRYIDGEPWREIAAVFSPSCSDSCVRMTVNRYLAAEGVPADSCDNGA